MLGPLKLQLCVCVFTALKTFETNVNWWQIWQQLWWQQWRCKTGGVVPRAQWCRVHGVTLEHHCCALQLGIMHMIIIECVSGLDTSIDNTQQTTLSYFTGHRGYGLRPCLKTSYALLWNSRVLYIWYLFMVNVRYWKMVSHIGAIWSPQLLSWGPTMYWSSNFLAVVFKKQEISQQVVTRMQDLVSEFSKIFRSWYPRTLTAGGGDPPHPTPASAAVLGPKPWSPQLFSRGCAPGFTLR